MATFSNLKLNTAGNYILNATAGVLSAGSSGQIVINSATTTHFTVETQPAVVGTTTNVTITARDDFGNFSTGYSGTVHFTNSDKKAGLPASYTFRSADSGQHTFSVIFQKAGSLVIVVSDNGHPALTGNATIAIAGGHAIQRGQAKTSAFGNGSQGPALLNSFNGGQTVTTLGDWLAASFANLFGSQAGSSNLAGKTNTQVATFYQSLPRSKGMTLELDALTTALNIYASTTDQGGTAGVSSGFKVSAGGLGASLQNVKSAGAAFGVPNTTLLTINQILIQTDSLLSAAVLSNSNSRTAALADAIFVKINS